MSNEEIHKQMNDRIRGARIESIDMASGMPPYVLIRISNPLGERCEIIITSILSLTSADGVLVKPSITMNITGYTESKQA